MSASISDKQSLQKTAVIDCDIHHSMERIEDLFPYLPRVYRDQIGAWGPQLPEFGMLDGAGLRGFRHDSFPQNNKPPGSDLSIMRDQLLDAYDIDYGILTGQFFKHYASYHIEYSAALCSAHNDWTVEHWLDKDDRLRGSILVPIHDSKLAVKEIERMAKDKRMVQVITVGGSRYPYGQRVFHPIYEKCVEYNLPFAIHSGLEGAGFLGTATGVGYPSHYLEYKTIGAGAFIAHLASFIFEGVFEIFSALKVGFLEAGIHWVAPALWQFDNDWKCLRNQTPWVKKPPSEYYKSNVFVGQQPLEQSPDKNAMLQSLKWMNAKENLVFCSNYPRWDFESPIEVLAAELDAGLRENILFANASEIYHLPRRKESD
ncbi:amidohydrolase family protein [Brevibacillus sp. B_LB10_24]|uniref:amidohydrolase family protein n=1 Tax=Brevibacillus sp. B_LB10_24 TaxID=3380645 RepID=UPI0038BAE66E